MRFLLSHILSAAAAWRLLRGFVRVAAARDWHWCIRMAERRGTAFALAVAMLTLLPLKAMAAPVKGNQIINSARLVSSGVTIANASVAVTVAKRTKASVDFLKYAPGLTGATPVNIAQGAYRQGSDSGPFGNLPQQVQTGFGDTTDLSSPIPLAPTPFYHQGEPVFIRVTDMDQNLDPNSRETVFVTVTDTVTDDTEVVRLTETGPNTGVFIGYILSGSEASSKYNGTLTVSSLTDSFTSTIRADYTDITYSKDHTWCTALVDPSGIIFDTVTGQSVDGVKITLKNADGSDATVYGDDGITPFPSTVITGSTVKVGNRTYDLTPGRFRFPLIAQGT